MAAVVEAAAAGGGAGKKAGKKAGGEVSSDPVGGRFGRVRANLKMGVLGLPNGALLVINIHFLL